VKYFFEWLFDWYILPYWEAVFPPKTDDIRKSHTEEGQTLDDG
jgi:hypothetical protein